MNNRRSYGIKKKTNFSITKGRISEINIEHREKQNNYRIFLKIKRNFKKFSKIENLFKRTIAFTLKTICKITVLIIKFSQIFKCSTTTTKKKL